jgi:hypothetical protein
MKSLRGIAPLEERLNVGEELRRLRQDPMRPLITEFRRTGSKADPFYLDDATTYLRAYDFYYQSLARFLPEMSLYLRWADGPYYVRKYGGKYTPSQAKLARKFNPIAPHLEMDYVNCLIHARLLMDRVARLSRWFLSGAELPSDTSFTDHRKFFLQRTPSLGEDEEYAEHIRNGTGWYEGLVEVRDKFIVHPGRAPFGMIPGIPSSGNEFSLLWLRTSVGADGRPYYDAVQVSVPRLTREIADFLRWF